MKGRLAEWSPGQSIAIFITHFITNVKILNIYKSRSVFGMQPKRYNRKSTENYHCVILVTYHGLAGAFLQIPQQDVVIRQGDDFLSVSRGLPSDTERRRSVKYQHGQLRFPNVWLRAFTHILHKPARPFPSPSPVTSSVYQHYSMTLCRQCSLC